jgi:hypothetical protein
MADNPPFSQMGRLAVIAAVVAASWQVDPYVFIGGQQPYAPRVLPIVTTPTGFTQAGTSPIIFEVEYALDPLPTLNTKLSPSITASVVNEPPYSNFSRTAFGMAIAASIAQPDPWVYGFFGAQQPYAPRRLTPSLIDIAVNNAPVTNAGRSAASATILALCQPPDPQPFVGGRQPTEPRRANPANLGVQVSNPPLGHPGRDWNPAGQFSACLAQPDPWTYAGVGGKQPYGPRVLPAVLLAVSVDQPPLLVRDFTVYSEDDPLPQRGTHLPASITATRVDQPPPLALRVQPPWPDEYYPVIVSVAPTPTVVAAPGVPQAVAEIKSYYEVPDGLPILPTKLAAATVPRVDQPPGFENDFLVVDVFDGLPVLPKKGAAALPQPVVSARTAYTRPWIESVVRSWQQPDPLPTLPRYAAALIPPPIVSTINPYTNTTLPVILASWQPPDPAPTIQRKLSPAIIAVPANQSGWRPTQLIAVTRTWQSPDPLPTLPGKLNPALLAVAVNNPPLITRDFIVYTTDDPLPQLSSKLSPNTPGLSVDQPPFIAMRMVGSWAKPWTLIQTLPSAFFPGVAVDNPPFTHRARTQLGISLAAWAAQPNPWTYTFAGGLQPFAGIKQTPPSGPLPPPVPDVIPSQGGGKKKLHTPYIPSPPYDVKPNKPFKPVWDRGGTKDEPKAAPAAAPIPPPPPELFSGSKTASLDVSKLPSLDQFGMPNMQQYGQQIHDAEDLSDIMRLLEELTAIDPNKS